MTVRVVLRKVAITLVCVLFLNGCSSDAQTFAVRAVAAGVPSLAPFFDEDAGLGHDAVVRSRPAPGGIQQGDTPGLYGGTRQPEICDVDRLEEFLTDPANERKAQAWASVLDVTTDGIPEYLDRLTPVLLRTDTLVKNHDYQKEKAVPFDALLQAGIAILVDERGMPAVKCSCGNPLRPFEGDTGRISVRFQDGNERWRGFDRASVVAVRPAPRTLDRLALVDVEDPARGIHRPAGTTGADDSVFDARERRAVPDVTGTTFGRASRMLAGAGLAVAVDGGGLPPRGTRVTASDPPAGTGLPFGAFVRVRVAGGAGGGPEDGPGDDGSGPAPGSSGSSGSSDSSGPSASGGSSGSSGPSDSAGSSGSSRPSGSSPSPGASGSSDASAPGESRDPSGSPGASDAPGPPGPSGPSAPPEPSRPSAPPDSPGSPGPPGPSGSPGSSGSPTSALPTREPPERPPPASPTGTGPPSSPSSTRPPPSPPTPPPSPAPPSTPTAP
ncbi:PASTA domain-containing protein [Streptomyces sp. JB150]|uniref:PASTA domain-containing protein n=1 Tax=Streptomyces sp. JB150 TaxID=2714844 RepID=UPI00140794DE|nr:PASTA domain-containing protein [Streptomyces sp. JB150]